MGGASLEEALSARQLLNALISTVVRPEIVDHLNSMRTKPLSIGVRGTNHNYANCCTRVFRSWHEPRNHCVLHNAKLLHALVPFVLDCVFSTQQSRLRDLQASCVLCAPRKNCVLPARAGHGYQMRVIKGSFSNAPECDHAALAGAQARGEAAGYTLGFEAKIDFESSEPLSLMLESLHFYLPNIHMEVRSFKVQGHVKIESSSGLGFLVFYFLHKPTVVWDMDVTISNAKFGVYGENLIPHYLLIPTLTNIDYKHPRLSEFDGTLKKYDLARYQRLRSIAIADALKDHRTRGCLDGLFGR